MSNKRRAPIFLLVGAAVLAGCATGPVLDATGVDLDLTPSGVVSNEARNQDAAILWGGLIVTSTNLHRGTEIEVLGYPLDHSQRPDTDRTPLGRFLVWSPGYLETLDYAPGRSLTVRGRVSGVAEGRVGQAGYRYPRIEADRLHLWRPSPWEGSRPRFHIGIGVGIHN